MQREPRDSFLGSPRGMHAREDLTVSNKCAIIIPEGAGFVKGWLTMVKFYGIIIKEVHRTHVQNERGQSLLACDR